MQIAFTIVLAGVGYIALHSLASNMTSQGIRTGFGFLWEPSTVASVTTVASGVDTAPTYAASILEGAANTLLAAVLVIVATTIIGLVAGVVQNSRLWLLAKMFQLYIGVTRNIPALVHVLFWYAAFRNLPAVRQALQPVPGIVLSNRGVWIPSPAHSAEAALFVAIAVVVSIGSAVLLGARLPTGIKPQAIYRRAIYVIVGFVAAGAVLAAVPWHLPHRQGLSYVGGASISIELTSLFIALALYHGSYIAEIVRAAIDSIPVAQREAAASLGLHRSHITWLIVIPQAIRVIMPQLPNEYIGALKGTALAVAIGFHDISTITATIVNNTGQAVEPMVILALFYLLTSGGLSGLVNGFNEFKLRKGLRR